MSSILPNVNVKRGYVMRMFTRIASHYDLMNKIMTFGQDSNWRRKAVKMLNPQNQNRYLDLGAGTGDLSYEIIRKAPGALVFAADLTMEMLLFAKEKQGASVILWVVADAQALPFRADSFSGVVSGYLLRNVPDINAALEEQIRVLQQNASLVSLDTTPPARNFFYPFILIFLKWVIPFIGRIVSGDSEAYVYLPESTQKHTTADVLAEKMRHAGLHSVNFEKLMLGTMALHSGQK
jgi:demethylmenaquinone methyltransferase / 2-methoxy-6-polyprenyl-1,4-benzoquinol methylase